MDPAHSWHPGNAAVDPVWPVPTPILPDEILSSWLVRLALRQGCDPLVMTGVLWPAWRFWTRDPDWLLPEKRLGALSHFSGVGGTPILAASLANTVARILGQGSATRLHSSWVVTLGTRNRKRAGGLQYCPVCLAEDQAPYFRLQWRFAWHTACEHHQVALRGRCCHCAAPLEPHRLVAEDKALNRCGSCKGDLRLCEPHPCSLPALAFQQAADETLRVGHGHLLGGRVTAAEWFAMAAFLVMAVRRWVREGTSGQKALMERLRISPPNLVSFEYGMGIEKLGTADRQELIGSIQPVIMIDRGRFLAGLSGSGITQQGFASQRGEVPEVLRPLVGLLPSKTWTRSSGKGVWTRKGPRSPREVARMMARLERKMARRRH